jgi:hypothetical protein
LFENLPSTHLRYGGYLTLSQGLKLTYDKATRVLKVAGSYSM